MREAGRPRREFQANPDRPSLGAALLALLREDMATHPVPDDDADPAPAADRSRPSPARRRRPRATSESPAP
jgi:hypothetical protein